MVFNNYNQTNNASGTLATPISNSSTVIVLESGQGDLFPTTNFKIRIRQFSSTGEYIKQEIALCTSRSGDALTITRAVEKCPLSQTSTTQQQQAQAFSAGSTIDNTMTAEDADDIKQAIEDRLEISVYNSEKLQLGTSATGNDSYQANISGITSYIDGQRYRIKVDVSNTGNATLQINALGAKSIKIGQGGSFVEIPSNTITAGGFAYFVYIGSSDIFQYTSNPGDVTITSLETTQTEVTLGENITQADLDNNRIGLYKNTSDSKYYKTDASNKDKINFAGVATEIGNTDDTIKMDTSGISGNKNSLTVNSDYFLANGFTSLEDSTNANYSSNTESSSTGYRVTVKNDCIISKVVHEGGFGINCFIKSDLGTTLATSTVSNGVATFNFNASASTNYRIEFQDSGTNRTRRDTSPSLPYTGTNIDYIGGSFGGSNVNNVYNIDYIETRNIGNEGLISDTPGENVVSVGRSISSSELKLSSPNEDKITIVASDSDLLSLPNDINLFTNTSYEKKKEAKLFYSGTYRISFTISGGGNSPQTCYGQIYKNGTAFGTERSISSTSSTFTEDLMFNAGDLVQLYCRVASGSHGSALDLTVKGSINFGMINID